MGVAAGLRVRGVEGERGGTRRRGAGLGHQHSNGGDGLVGVDGVEVGEVQAVLRFAGREGGVVGVIALHAQEVTLGLQFPGHLELEGMIGAEAIAQLLAIEEDLTLAHHGLEVQGEGDGRQSA